MSRHAAIVEPGVVGRTHNPVDRVVCQDTRGSVLVIHRFQSHFAMRLVLAVVLTPAILDPRVLTHKMSNPRASRRNILSPHA
jgi:hypothetical protein